MKKLLFIIIILFMIAGGVLVYTSPSEDSLRKDIEVYLTDEIKKTLPDAAINDGYAVNIIHLNINQSIIISDYYFFKKVVYEKNKNKVVIGYGYLNKFHGK